MTKINYEQETEKLMEEYREKYHDKIRDSFEQELLDNWEDEYKVSEIDKWRNQFLILDIYWRYELRDKTDKEIYSILKKAKKNLWNKPIN